MERFGNLAGFGQDGATSSAAFLSARYEDRECPGCGSSPLRRCNQTGTDPFVATSTNLYFCEACQRSTLFCPSCGSETGIRRGDFICLRSGASISACGVEKAEEDPFAAEVRSYGKSIGMTATDTDRFIAYNAARNWQINGQPIADWQALMRGWQRRSA